MGYSVSGRSLYGISPRLHLDLVPGKTLVVGGSVEPLHDDSRKFYFCRIRLHSTDIKRGPVVSIFSRGKVDICRRRRTSAHVRMNSIDNSCDDDKDDDSG